ncbi:LuxR C-terminal-related transcriptional regulator [Nocardia sp. GTS18]|uniref:LuxR C-terminal-related transcriptional regulator n=1 Tax=Nocardia sp. GTS18 TaxID=1778064 RepID=UPI0015EFCDAB|nr:LuxR C-terminal-related transcriptional regulator [Nocardia sp. GTS18]
MARSAIAVAGRGTEDRVPELSFAPVRCDAATAAFDSARTAPGHVVLVCGPAGSGKTVAMVDWVNTARPAPRLAWLTVSTSPGADLLAAVARALDPTAATVPDGVLRTPADRAADLVAALADTEETVLVIDDVHLLTDPLQLAGLEYLLTRLPPKITALLGGRFEPPLRWHVLDLAGRLTRLGATELAMPPDRVAQLLAQHDCHLDDTELAALHELTRGWAALVRIAAISLGTDDRSTALTALAAPTHAVADFLFAELIETLPPRTVEFLLTTAVPTRFCLPMAEELLGLDASRILDELLRASFPLHTVATDGQLWYTYHPLLRAYLLAEAAHTRAERLPGLHRHLAEWFTGAALPGCALDHVLAEPGAPGLASFLWEWGVRLVLDGRGHLLLHALDQVPGLSDDTFVGLLRAAVAVEDGEIAAAEVYLEAAHVGSWPGSALVPAEWIAALDHAVSAGVAVLAGDSASMRWPLPPVTGQTDLDCYVALHCGAAEVFGGRIVSGTAALRHAVVYAEEAGLGRVAVRARTAVAAASGITGRVGELRVLAAQALECADRYGLTGSSEAAMARVTAAYGAHRQGCAYGKPLPDLSADDLTTPALLRQARIVIGVLTFDDTVDRAAAATMLSRRLHHLLDDAPALLGAGNLVTEVLWLLLRVHAKVEARALVDHATRVLGKTVDTQLAEAALALHTQRPAAVLPLLTPLVGEVTDGQAVAAWLLIAVAADHLDRPRKVEDAFEQALAHASGEHLIRPFLDVPGAAELLDRLGSHFGRYDAFVDHVRAHRGAMADAPRLTDTELVVLRRLPSGLTATSIAADLGVSVNTVKTHLRGIYQKLGVNARGAAIAQARCVGLL